MQRQGSFSQAAYAGKKKQTRRDKFLAEMEQVVPWSRLVARLQPLYPKGERGRPPIGLERMLRIYFLQQRYGLADEALEDALYDSHALRDFAGIDLNHDPVPDATTLLKFRHWLARHELTRALFDDIAAMLEERGLLMRQGTIVDATIIAAPPSTKNKSKSRDPEMHQTKKGNQWHFGMKAHIGVDVTSGGGAHAHRHRRQRSRHQPDRSSIARPGGGGLRRCRLYRGGQAAGTCRPRGLLEHRDQARHHQSLAESPAGLGGADGAGAGTGAGLGRASLPRGQEPVPAQQAALPRAGQEHRATAFPVRPRQPGDRHENPSRTIADLTTARDA